MEIEIRGTAKAQEVVQLIREVGPQFFAESNLWPVLSVQKETVAQKWVKQGRGKKVSADTEM